MDTGTVDIVMVMVDTVMTMAIRIVMVMVDTVMTMAIRIVIQFPLHCPALPLNPIRILVMIYICVHLRIIILIHNRLSRQHVLISSSRGVMSTILIILILIPIHIPALSLLHPFP